MLDVMIYWLVRYLKGPVTTNITKHNFHVNCCIPKQFNWTCDDYVSCRYSSCWTYWPWTGRTSVQGHSIRLWQTLHCTSS